MQPTQQSGPKNIAQEALGTGRRALAGTFAGGVWIAWGLITARVLTPAILAPVALVGVLLLAGCGYCIGKGLSLRKEYPFPRGPLNAWFLLVTLLEAMGVFGVITVAQKTSRPQMLPAWIGIVIGLHFLLLAKAFHTRIYYFTGTATTLWCILCWALFREDAITIPVCIGTGSILWVTSLYNLSLVVRRLAGRTP